MKNVLLYGAVVGLGAGTASAGLSPGTVSFTYANQEGGQSLSYTFDEGDALATITVDAMVDVSFNFTGIGGTPGEVIEDVRVTKTASVLSATEIGPGTFLAEVFDASFTFMDTMGTPDMSDDVEILSGSYGTGTRGTESTGALFIVGSSGSIVANSTFDGGELSYTLGSGLATLLSDGGLVLGEQADASWTITNVDPGVQGDGNGFFEDFIADSAFTGSFTAVPSPGSMALASIAGIFLVRTRNRK